MDGWIVGRKEGSTGDEGPLVVLYKTKLYYSNTVCREGRFDGLAALVWMCTRIAGSYTAEDQHKRI